MTVVTTHYRYKRPPRTNTDRHLHIWRIIERYAEDPRLPAPSADLLSQEASVSVRTLYNVCRAFTGKSATRYIKQRRLMLAREMLQQARPETATVAQIATFCGFNHLGHFSKDFRDLHGQQPSSILRQDEPKQPSSAASTRPWPHTST